MRQSLLTATLSAVILLTASAFSLLPALAFALFGLTLYARLWNQVGDFGVALAGSVQASTRRLAAKSPHPTPRVWVLVACRNESQNIASFFSHLRALSSPIAGLIWVDDHSSDDSIAQAQLEAETCPFPVKLVPLTGSSTGKKAALNAGRCCIPPEADWVWFTDADCRLPASSLNQLLAVAPTRGVALGPLHFEGKKSLLSDYQKMENSALLALTQWGLNKGHLLMANGGNLLMHPSLIQPLNSQHAASGDDIFALETAYQKTPHAFAFAEGADGAARTEVEPDFYGFLQQRLRWMRKTPLQLDKSSLYLQIALGLFAFSPLYFLLLGLFFAPDEFSRYSLLASVLWLGKACIDHWVLAPVLRRRGQDISRAWLLSILQTLWLPTLGLLALWPSPFAWKGRKAYR